MSDDAFWLNNSTTPKTETKSRIGTFLIALTGGIGVALSVICIPFVTPALRKKCLPYVPATNQQVENVLKALEGRSGSIIDLGSGDGRLVFAAAKNGFESYGVELNLWLVLYSKLSALGQGLSSRAVFQRQDLWKLDLKKYDNIILFGVEQMMMEMEQKMLNGLKQDCRVIVCRFPLPNLNPIKIIGTGVDTVWVYHPSCMDKS